MMVLDHATPTQITVWQVNPSLAQARCEVHLFQLALSDTSGVKSSLSSRVVVRYRGCIEWAPEESEEMELRFDVPDFTSNLWVIIRWDTRGLLPPTGSSQITSALWSSFSLKRHQPESIGTCGKTTTWCVTVIWNLMVTQIKLNHLRAGVPMMVIPVLFAGFLQLWRDFCWKATGRQG